MYLNGIWIKAIALLVMSVITLACGIYAVKKMNWKTFEFIFVVIICLCLFVTGCKNMNYAVNPEIETINVQYNHQSGSGVIFGREYFFTDINGESYVLTMDPITTRKIFKGNYFEKNKIYTVGYEKKSETIVYISEYN